RVALSEHLEAIPVGGDGVALGGDVGGKATQDAVVLEKVRQRLGIGDVVDGDHVDVRRGALTDGAIDIAPDAAEAVDADLDGHPPASCRSRSSAVPSAGTGRKPRRIVPRPRPVTGGRDRTCGAGRRGTGQSLSPRSPAAPEAK